MRPCVYMKLNIQLLRWAGGWPRFDQLHTTAERLYVCYSLFVVFAFFGYVMIQLYGLSVYYHAWRNLDAAIEDFIVVATGLIALIKMLLVMWNQQQLHALITELNAGLRQQDRVEVQRSDESALREDEAVLQSCVKHERRLTKTYLGFAYCITVLYLTSSLSRIIKKKAGVDMSTLPLKYPFHLEHSPWYPLAYFHQVIVMYVNGQVGVVTDSFFSCLLYYLCGHFQIIANKMATMKENKLEVVNYHRQVLECVRRVQNIFNTFLTLQLSLTAFLICLATFQITQIEDFKPIHYIKCFIYLVIKVWQLYMYCWYGEEISYRSQEVSRAVYKTSWYDNLTRQATSNVMLIMQCSQHPLTMTAGIFFTLSLKTFRSVINTAYTCFTLLNIMALHS